MKVNTLQYCINFHYVRTVPLRCCILRFSTLVQLFYKEISTF